MHARDTQSACGTAWQLHGKPASPLKLWCKAAAMELLLGVSPAWWHATSTKTSGHMAIIGPRK